MHYELLSLAVYENSKFITYFLHSCQIWYKDDGDDLVPVTAFEACNQKKAFYFIYRKFKDEIEQIADIPRIIDMITDSYGKSKDNQVAISLQLPIGSNRGVTLDECRLLIKKYENANIQNYVSFKNFFLHKNIHIWRYHNKNDPDHEKMYNSCTDNGTSGFQLDYLLRERIVHNTGTKLQSKDKYMNVKNKITNAKSTSDFLYYLKILLENKNYFPPSIKPKIHKDYEYSLSFASQNKYPSYEKWITHRTVEYKKSINKDKDTIYNAELSYYKIYAALTWLQNQPDLKQGIYSPFYTPKLGMNISLWWDSTIFNYTKYDHDFSIFYNNEEIINTPFIKNYYILQYTTICDQNKYEYTLPDAEISIKNKNHGALDGIKYHLLNTEYFDNHIDECFRSLYENINYIFKYGEFHFPEEEPLNRWGGKINYKRNYDLCDMTKSSDEVELVYILFDSYKLPNNLLINEVERYEKQKTNVSSIVLEGKKNNNLFNEEKNKNLKIDNNIIKSTNKNNTTNNIKNSDNLNVHRQFVDVIFRNLEEFLLEETNSQNELIKLNIVNKIKQFKNKMQITNKQQQIITEPNNVRINNVINLIELSEQSEILKNLVVSPRNKKSRK